MKLISDILKRCNLTGVFIAALGATAAFTACDNSSEIGTDLVNDEISIVVDSSFVVTGHSVQPEALLSRTVTQLLGLINAPEYGTISSDFVTQFMPAIALDTAGITEADIDSLKLVMLASNGAFVGDSLALMGLEVYPLTRQLQAPIYSDFDPTGYYDASTLLGSTVYNLTKRSLTDIYQQMSYYTIDVKLPLEMGRKLFTEYVNNPATFASPQAFAQFFPGLYIRNSYGSGRLTRIGNTTMRMYYHLNTVNDQGNDTTIYKTGTYFAVTPEIITNNDISLSMAPQISQRVQSGQTILLAPGGLNVELTFPAPDIIRAYRSGIQDALGVVNNLTMKLPVETIANKYDIGIPNDVILVRKDKKEEFFLNNQLPDNLTSFSASLTYMSDGSTAYYFPDMRQYIVELLAKDKVTPEDYTFVLIPVSVTSENNDDIYGGSTSTVTAITPYVSEPKMVQILLDKAKINFVYSRQTTNF